MHEEEKHGKKTEDQDPEDQESETEVTIEQRESVNITPPPEYVIKKRTALTFPCSYCEKLFQTSLLRNVHEEENHGDVFQTEKEKSFPCDVCNFLSNYLTNLKRHGELKHKKRKAHRQEVVTKSQKRIKTAFSCEDCSYKCAWNHNLKRHVKLMHQAEIH